MSATPPPSDQPCAHCGGAEDWRADQLAILRELNDLNMHLARVVVATAEAAAQPRDEADAQPAPSAADPSLALSRLGRAVRLTLAMEARLRGEAQGAADAVRTARTAREDAVARERSLSVESAREFIAETLEGAVELAPREVLEERDTPDRERLLEDVFDRIDGLSDDILFDVPEGVLIERLCAEFGLDRDPDTIADRYEDKLWKGWSLPPAEPSASPDAPKEPALELSS